MSGIFLFAAALVAIPVSIRLTMALLDRKRQNLPPFCGRLKNIKVVPPRYVDTKRVGSRIDFILQLWGNGDTRTKIKSVMAYVSDNANNTYERPLLRQNPVSYNYVFHKGVNVPFDVCLYVDNIKPEDIDANSLVVEVTDTEGKKHLIERER